MINPDVQGPGPGTRTMATNHINDDPGLIDSDSELFMAVSPRKKQPVVQDLSYLDLENGHRRKIPYHIKENLSFPGTCYISFDNGVGKERKRKTKEQWCKEHSGIPLVDMYTLLWSKRASLKGRGVWIAEDFPVEIEKKRKQLWPFVRAARQGDPDHPDTKISAYLKADKMIINKKSYDDPDALPPFVKYNYANPPSTKTTDGVTLFFSKSSPFSNFHPCTFVIEEISYTSIEQYLCHQKALKFDSADTAASMLYTDDPKVLKQRAKSLANFDKNSWESDAGAILKVGLSAKFDQCPDLKAKLLSTGDNLLGEASAHDILFGIGLSLHNPNALNPHRWRGENLQGKTLMEVREALR